MSVIDIHEHVIPRRGFLLPTGKTVVTGEELVALMDRLGIDKSVILPLSSPETYHFVQSNEEALEVCDKWPDRFIKFCNVDPRHDVNDPDYDFSRILEYYKSVGCKGLGEFTANLRWEDPRVLNLLRACAAASLPVTVHLTLREFKTYGIISTPGLYDMERVMEAIPELVILGHSPKFWDEVAPLQEGYPTYPKGPVAPGGRLPYLLRKFKGRLWGDMSAGSGWNAVARDPEWGYAFIEEFHDQLLFGLDICQPTDDTPSLCTFMAEALANGNISTEAHEKIMGGNAERLLTMADTPVEPEAERAATVIRSGPESVDDFVRREIVYKSVNGADLVMHLFEPAAAREAPLGAIVFFFGGGWNGGSPGQFFPHCEYLAGRGMVAASAEYRVKSRHGVTPFECVADGKSAVRWLRAHAEELGVDPARVAAGGGSAGGHVAACTGVIAGLDDPSDDRSVSSRPDALVLFNPVVDLGENCREALLERFEGRGLEASPLHHVRPGAPPTMIFHGTADTTVPFADVERFTRRMAEAGNDCRLVPFEGYAHAFFNYGQEDKRPYYETVRRMDAFLTELGFLPEPQEG